MSIFEKAVSKLEQSDLIELLQDEAVENIRLEFKREVPQKDETLKKLSSFANTFGGFVVVGAEADSKDGRLIALPGVDRQPSYKQTLVQWCFGSVSPPLTVEVSDPIPAPEDSTKVCYVVFVPESDLAPHFLNGRKGVYVRTDEFSSRFEAKLATENELRQLLGRRGIIRQRRTDLIDRARSRFQSFTNRSYKNFKTAYNKPKESIGARFDLAIVPRFPAEAVCEHTALIGLMKPVRIDWRGTTFPREPNPITQHESVINLGPSLTFALLEVNVWGLLFFASEVEDHTENFAGNHVHQFLGLVLAFIHYSAKILRQLRYAGPLRVEMRMEGMRGINWIHVVGSVPYPGPCSELDDTIQFSLESTTDELMTAPDKVAINVVRDVFLATNWHSLITSKQHLEDLLRSAYKFNHWNESTFDE